MFCYVFVSVPFLFEQTLRTICFMESCFNLVAITLQQYFEIVHPILHKTRFYKIKPVMVIGVCWFLSLLYSVPFSVATSGIIYGQCVVFNAIPSPEMAKFAAFATLFIGDIIPASVMILSFFRMAYILHKKNSRTQPVSATDTFDRAKVKIIKTLLLLGLIFICSWSPNLWIYFLVANGTVSYTVYFSWVYPMSILLLFSSCAINPFVFAARYKKFKTGVIKLLKKNRIIPEAETLNMRTMKTTASIND